MKFNWGHGVTIGFIAFAVYILSFVYRSFQKDVDLVAEDYYAQEVAYQDRIDQERNAVRFEHEVTITRSNDGVALDFSPVFLKGFERGEVLFFRPSDKEKDLSLPIQVDATGQMVVPAELLSPGRYKINIRWEGEESYYLSKDLVI